MAQRAARLRRYGVIADLLQSYFEGEEESDMSERDEESDLSDSDE